MLDGSGVQITRGEHSPDVAGPPRPLASCARDRDRANREALDAFERSASLAAAAGCASGSSMRMSRPEDLRGSPSSASRRPSVLARPSDERSRDAFGRTSSAGRTRSARCRVGAVIANGSDAPIEELDPWGGVGAAGSATGARDQRLTLESANYATCVAPAWLRTTSASAALSSRAATPISSCSTATVRQ